MSDVYHLLILFFLIISKESFSSNECFLECKISTLCEQSCPDGLFYLISSTTMTINVTSCPIENTNRTNGFVTNTFETDTSTLKHQEKTTTMDHSTIDNTTKSILTSSFGNIAETTIFSNTLETPSLSLFEIENMTVSIITSNFGSKVDTSIFSSTLETFSLSLFENISSPKIRTPYSENLEGSRLATSISSIFNFSEAGITFSSDILFSGSSSKKDTNKSSSEIKGKIVMSLSGTTNFMKSETKNIMLNFTDDIVMELESNMLTPTPSSSIYSSEILEPFHTIIYHLCVEKCPDGYYANETNERCISCRDVCTNCSASDSLQRNCACNVTNSIDELCSDVDVKSSIALVTIIIVCIASVLVFLGVIVVVLCVLRKKRRLERKNSHVSESGIEIIAINECVQFDKDTSDSRYFRGSTLTVQELSYSKDSSRSRYIRDPTLTIQAETHSREEGSYDYAVKRSVNPPYDDAHGETDKSEQGYHYATARSLNATIRNEDNSYKTNTLFITPFIMSENSTDINIRHSKGNESKSTSLSSEFDLGKKYHCIDYVDIAQHNTKGTESYQKRFNNSYERTGVDFVSSEMTSTCNLNSSTSESEHSIYSNSVVINWYGKPDPIYDSCDYTDSDSCNSVVDNQLEQTSDKDRSAKSSNYENVNNYDSDSCNSLVDDQLEQTSDKDRSAKSSEEDYENVNNYDSDSCNSLVDDQLEQTSDIDRSAKSSEEDYENFNNYDSDSCNSLVDDQLEQTSDIDRSAKSSEEDYENVNNYELADKKQDLELKSLLFSEEFKTKALYHRACFAKFLFSIPKKEEVFDELDISEHHKAFRCLVRTVFQYQKESLNAHISSIKVKQGLERSLTLDDSCTNFMACLLFDKPKERYELPRYSDAYGKMKALNKLFHFGPAFTKGYQRLNLNFVAYALVIDAKPSDMATVFTTIKQCLDMSKRAGQQYAVQKFDQQLYNVAQQMKWSMPDVFQSHIIRHGGCHGLSCFIATVGKLWASTGLYDLLVDSGMYAPNTVDQMIVGK
ncbi:unnamed protein product [Mytilus coruscus]|uniref:TNFR-Cys domain-containing protein n=1 Tax=Mytilus coruscus TaxID=42192 RepID=A0A6J8ABP7_MYTCO|nr:unnamed protein product [Mytilus coruscus]